MEVRLLVSSYFDYVAKFSVFCFSDADPGEATNLLRLQQEYRDKYDILTEDQKRDMCTLLIGERDSQTFGIRVNQKGCAQDVMNTFRRVTAMVSFFHYPPPSVEYYSLHVQLIALKCRCGVEAFIGLVRNNTEYDLRPQWFFTSPPINRYLTGAIKKWDVEVIGSQMEAFAIAGCELFSTWSHLQICSVSKHINPQLTFAPIATARIG